MSERRTLRHKIQKTVEQAVPLSEIDVTKVLTEEESAELIRQTRQRSEAVKLAAEVGRAGLKARLKKTMMSYAPEDVTEEDPTSEPSS
jgi:Tfp pilus assembly protein PilO